MIIFCESFTLYIYIFKNNIDITLQKNLAGIKFGGWKEKLILADGGKHIFWQELNLAD